jgi:hypothetical protein
MVTFAIFNYEFEPIQIHLCPLEYLTIDIFPFILR